MATMNGDLKNGVKEQPAISSFQPNPALYVTQDHKIYMDESAPLEPGDDDCVVRMRANGICGSDLHLWKSGAIGELIVNKDHILGHEGAGEVVWLGKNVSHLSLHDRVAVEPGVPCTACHNCTTGEYNLCPTVKFSGVPSHHGSIRRYHVHPAQYLHKLPDDLSYGQGALLEPLSVLLHAFERAPPRLGEPSLICGAGPIGIIALLCAKASGAYPLVITDIDADRLAFAKKLVPNCMTVTIAMGADGEVVGALVRAEFEKVGAPLPRVSYECTGVASSVHSAVWATRRGGEVMVVGVGRSVMDGLPFMHASMAEIDIKFINRYHHSWPHAMRVLQSGYIDLRPLVTHTYKLEEAKAALETAGDRAKASVKVHILDED